MAKTSLIQIPVGLDITYFKSLQSGDRFTIPHIKVKRLFTSRSRKKGLTQKSLMVKLAPVWAAFSQEVRDAWNTAGLACDMSGWKLFIQDTAVRVANGISEYATPSELYQSKVGKIKIEAPAVGFTILQLHPQKYFINKKVSGTRSQYAPKLITEDLTLPVDIAISYKSDLSSAGDSPFAKFFIIVYSNYQGRTIENVCEIDFALVHDWERLTASISGVLGQFRGYTAFIQIHDCRGTLLFDNVNIFHTGLNWARDPFCNSIATTFTKAYYQIPKNWAPEVALDGAFYGSVYHTAYTPPQVEIGDSYQGGIVAYILQSGDPDYDPDIQHGIIAHSSDLNSSIQWYNGSDILTGASSSLLGQGLINTNLICSVQGAGNYAAKICADLVVGEYSDWFLPSKNELLKLYQNRVLIGGFNSSEYWCSTEFSSSVAYECYFVNGGIYSDYKRTLKAVRPVRYF